MKELTLKQAAEDCRGTLTPEQAEGMITGVQIDSRRVKPGDLFVAIKGEKSDGHDFIGMAASLWRKCRACAKTGQGGHPDHSRTRYHQGLRRSCRSPPRTDGRERHRHYRQRRQNDDQGNDRLYAGAATDRTARTEGNHNNNTGLPMTILDMPDDTETAVLELGMNHFGEMARLNFYRKARHRRYHQHRHHAYRTSWLP